MSQVSFNQVHNPQYGHYCHLQYTTHSVKSILVSRLTNYITHAGNAKDSAGTMATADAVSFAGTTLIMEESHGIPREK